MKILLMNVKRYTSIWINTPINSVFLMKVIDRRSKAVIEKCRLLTDSKWH